jgi:hypothetical protein
MTTNNKTQLCGLLQVPESSWGKITRANENPEGKHGGLSDAAAANWPCQTRQNLISAMVHSRRRHRTRLSESVA